VDTAGKVYRKKAFSFQPSAFSSKSPGLNLQGASSREAAPEYSPRRKPWVNSRTRASPEGAKETALAGESYRRNRPIRYITTESTTLTRIDVASGK
jgi:hypothetical protein